MIEAHSYNEEQSAKVGILGRLFSGDVSRVKGGVVHDAKRFSIGQTEEGRWVEVGVAVRLSVATSDLKSELQLTLPNLAAEAHLNNVDMRIGITVTGYAGPLGHLLPAPAKLDVDSYVAYIDAFRRLQALVLGQDGWRHVHPTVLSYDRRCSMGKDAV